MDKPDTQTSGSRRKIATQTPPGFARSMPAETAGERHCPPFRETAPKRFDPAGRPALYPQLHSSDR